MLLTSVWVLPCNLFILLTCRQIYGQTKSTSGAGFELISATTEESHISQQQRISGPVAANPVAGYRNFSILLGICWVYFVLLIFCHAEEGEYNGYLITIQGVC